MTIAIIKDEYMENIIIQIAIPSKGKLAGPALEFLKRKDISPIPAHERTYQLDTKIPWAKLLRRNSMDIPEDVARERRVIVGITGLDCVMECGIPLQALRLDDSAPVSMSVIVPSGREPDFSKGISVATKFPNIAGKFFRENGIRVQRIRKLNGAVESSLFGEYDAIVDIVETKVTIEANDQKEIMKVMDVYPVLVLPQIPKLDALIDTNPEIGQIMADLLRGLSG